MYTLFINGKESSLGASSAQTEYSLGELLGDLRKDLVHESQLITSIKIDGNEIDTAREDEFRALPIAAIRSLEIKTAHPKEIAQETLQSLIGFADILKKMSVELSIAPEDSQFYPMFIRLLNGLEAMIDSITASKLTLRIGRIDSVAFLEVDLKSILTDLLSAKEKDDVDFLKKVLGTDLPENLHEWMIRGLPELIRSRDS